MKLHLHPSVIIPFIWTAIALPAGAQTPPPDAPPPAIPMVRICDETGCSYRPKDAVSTETVDTNQEDPGIARLKQIAETHPKAAYDLGLRYFRGDGVRQDSYQALVWMRKAGERGNLQAQKALGGFYLFGLEEMGADPQEAEKWLMLADAQGDKESKKLLKQARAAKKADQEDFKWLTRWRTVYYGYWHSGYRYYGVWRQTYRYGY
jgi:hypothetical protein